MPNPYSPPRSSQAAANPFSPSESQIALGIGAVLYLLRGAAVLAYGLWLMPVPIGGPNIDAGGMVWIPFLIADLPWSLWFPAFSFPSNAIALGTYTVIVGLPWIAYGYVLARLVMWIYRKLLW